MIGNGLRRIFNIYLGMLLLVIVNVLPAPANANTDINNAPDFTPVRITSSSLAKVDLQDWLYFHDSNDITRLPTLLDQPENNWHKVVQHPIHAIGLRNYWVGFSVYNPNEYLERVLTIDNPLIDSIKLFHLIDGRLVNFEHMGDSLPYTERPIQANTFMLPIELSPGEQHTFLLRINTLGNIDLPIKLWAPKQLAQYTETKSLLQGLQIGLLAAIALFSLFIALASKSFSYSYYCCYVMGIAVLTATYHGLTFRYLWPNTPELQRFVISFFVPLIIGFSFMFTEKLLRLKYYSINMLRACRLLAAISFAMCLIFPVINYAYTIRIAVPFVLIATLILVVFSSIQAFRGMRNAPLFAAGRTLFLLGCVISGCMYFGLISLNWDLQTPIMLGLTVEVITMSAALAVRYQDERKEKMRIQQKALEQAQRIRETREEAIRIEAEANEKLENMVQERTLELEITLRELNEVNQKLTEQNTIDSLTGVKNRSEFDRRLKAEGRISRRQQTPIAILMVDIDKFKAINDQFGHLAGDTTIKAIAKSLSHQIKRPTDLVSRYGGEEFAIILPNTSTEGAMKVAEQMRADVKELDISWQQQSIQLTISIGVSVATIESDNHPNELLDQADQALYQAKRSGRNKVCNYEPEIESQSRSQM
ncbi:diguanylate cyclase [Shewanella maritima]|uniref:sensor domain-containing diguanylate cyclase n=1 Tax=Shewanella maritima TaxID=2520507 RepID=UPI003735643A